MATTSSAHTPPALTPHEMRRVAVESGTDPRTVKRYIEGEPIVSTCADRIRRALAALGYPDVRQRGNRDTAG